MAVGSHANSTRRVSKIRLATGIVYLGLADQAAPELPGSTDQLLDGNDVELTVWIL